MQILHCVRDNTCDAFTGGMTMKSKPAGETPALRETEREPGAARRRCDALAGGMAMKSKSAGETPGLRAWGAFYRSDPAAA